MNPGSGTCMSQQPAITEAMLQRHTSAELEV